MDWIVLVSLFLAGGWFLFAWIALTFGLPIAIVVFLARGLRR